MTAPTTETIVAPLPEQNRVDAVGQRTAKQVAQNVVEAHKAGLQARRQALLVCEKLLLHADGGELMWADIFRGVRVEIPRTVSAFRKSENLLRLIIDNAVAHHTSAPLRYFVDSLPDRQARDRALIDALWMNYLAQRQNLNGLFADALYMAMPAGFCPVHAYWRDDQNDQYEPVEYGGGDQGAMMPNPQPGMIDCWLGNPFDHVFDANAKRGSIHWQSYGRILPADLVRRAFSDIPGVDKIEGSKRLPSAANFQRIAKAWSLPGLGMHGTPVMEYRRHIEADEEMLTLVCREALPGYEADWPEGRLQIVAVPGEVDLRDGRGKGGQAILLADQALPAGDFSSTLFYSHQRSEDVHGKPWIEDIDQLNVDLNIALSKRWELTDKMVEAPIVAPAGAISDDMAYIDGLALLELEPSMAGWRPRVMEWNPAALQALDNMVAFDTSGSAIMLE